MLSAFYWNRQWMAFGTDVSVFFHRCAIVYMHLYYVQNSVIGVFPFSKVNSSFWHSWTTVSGLLVTFPQPLSSSKWFGLKCFDSSCSSYVRYMWIADSFVLLFCRWKAKAAGFGDEEQFSFCFIVRIIVGSKYLHEISKVFRFSASENEFFHSPSLLNGAFCVRENISFWASE